MSIWAFALVANWGLCWAFGIWDGLTLHSHPSAKPPSAVLPMASAAAKVVAAADAATSTRAHSLSRIFSSSSPNVQSPNPNPKPKPKPEPKIMRAPTPKPPAADAGSDADDKLWKPLGYIIKGLLRERDPEKLVSDFVAASSASARFRDRHRVYEMAVSRLASLGRQDSIETILGAQKRFLETSKEGFATRLIGLYGRAAMPAQASATFHELPAQLKCTMTLNAVLTAYYQAKEFDALATAFQEISVSHPLVVPSVYSYNILIRALCQKHDLSAALNVITLMEKCGVLPDNISFNTLLNGFYQNGRMDDAEAVWEMMKGWNLEPDTKSYNAKLRGLVAEGRIEDAVAVVERMEKEGPKPDTVSYNELIRGYCSAGRLEDAKKLYDGLVKNECAPNRGTYETLLPRLLQAGELDCAVRYCHGLLSPNTKNCRVDRSLLQDVVTTLVEASRVDEAAKIVELGRKKYYLRKLLMPHTEEDNEVQTEPDEEESTSEEKVCEVEQEIEK
ncbi:hypothetical protein BRADI_2g52016v3 [Brachypodium distachyon]|uniref:Pentacotripeptide-repeat region of PRORP domain-containing protein n=1 Tax=Brachypodium distachyon TaxID=15368 RepID=A0A2K2DFG5_BRADI|nr:hypothetical protein BRADI_2g52016v3 [Brachypodium distachyon]PNT73009.1 hypothetical protein BRADI_2g52016v3 [Brachypodium distachyon]PNT73010.1 hypothetical protein BRADI_2g52016v3 [Brachypodium distachyon]